MPNSFNLTILISGSGTTLKNLIDARAAGRFEADIVQVISSNPNVAGNEFALQHGIPLTVLSRNSFASADSYSEAIFDVCRIAETDLVVMAGFLKRVIIPQVYENRVINIHPSLIPAFSGKGFYGRRVHAAVLEYGCKVTGCTVHFVDNQYDHGPIIVQVPVCIESDDTVEVLQQRVFQTECRVYPGVIDQLVKKRISVRNRTVIVNRLD